MCFLDDQNLFLPFLNDKLLVWIEFVFWNNLIFTNQDPSTLSRSNEGSVLNKEDKSSATMAIWQLLTADLTKLMKLQNSHQTTEIVLSLS